MENGTVRVFRDGKWLEGKLANFEVKLLEMSTYPGFDDKFEYRIVLDTFPTPMEPQPIDGDHPEPFNDGEYLHYTRFHPQLKDMIGTEGYFYDTAFNAAIKGVLKSLSENGSPMVATFDINRIPYAFFAVPIKPEKTELTPHEVADKFGVPVEQLRIKE